MLERHPLNRSFSWPPTSGPLRRVTREQARAYDESGFFLLEDAFDPDTVASLIREIDPLEARAEAFLRKQEGGRMFIAQADAITFTVHLVKRSPYLREFCSGEVFRDLCHDLIGPDARLYWDQAVYKKPEPEREFPWHQDNGYTYLEPQRYLTCWVALTDTDERNGCPWVAPGVHRIGTLRHWMTELGWQCLEKPQGAVPLRVPAGGIAVFSSLTPHRTAPNRSAEVRKAYIVQFAPDGALRYEPDASGGYSQVPCDVPDRQFPILIRGEPAQPSGQARSGAGGELR